MPLSEPMRTIVLLFILIWFGCDRPDPDTMNPDAADISATFSSDVEFLRNYGDIHILRAPNGGRVAVSAQYQGRIMTSAVAEDGLSFGWINRDFIEAGETGTPFDNYGGEDRFWLGPEGGQYSLYFPPEAEFNLNNWQVPPALQEGTWTLVESTDSGVTYRTEMHLSNYGGADFEVAATRTVRLLVEDSVANILGENLPKSVEWVAFESENRVENTGNAPWMEEDGLVSIWILGMFKPLGTSWVIVPFEGEPSDSLITDAYFGEVPSDRLMIRDGYALFKADGEYRSKIGVPAEHAAPVLGSYSPEANALTIVQFDRPEDARRYVNSLWKLQDDPYGGDVVNSYNDGPPNPGGFYEMETSSPALDLAPGESFTHRHRTIHVIGSPDAIDSLATSVLGASTLSIGE